MNDRYPRLKCACKVKIYRLVGPLWLRLLPFSRLYKCAGCGTKEIAFRWRNSVRQEG